MKKYDTYHIFFYKVHLDNFQNYIKYGQSTSLFFHGVAAFS